MKRCVGSMEPLIGSFMTCSMLCCGQNVYSSEDGVLRAYAPDRREAVVVPDDVEWDFNQDDDDDDYLCNGNQLGWFDGEGVVLFVDLLRPVHCIETDAMVVTFSHGQIVGRAVAVASVMRKLPWVTGFLMGSRTDVQMNMMASV